jgi:hypothetical protein
MFQFYYCYQSLGSRGFSGSRYSESADTEHTNRTGNSRASRGDSEEGSGSGYTKDRERERERDQRRGSTRGYQNSTSANIEKEKNSKRSQETADKLYTILNGRGKDGKSSRLSMGVASGVPPKPSRRMDMKSILRQSSAGAFEGLQLETVDPDFVFPGGAKTIQPSSSSSSISTSIVSAAGDRNMHTSPSINTTTSTPMTTAAITKKNLDLLKRPETDTDSIATASTVLLSTANTEELLCWKGQSNNNSAEQSCPSTPSTVEDIQVGVDLGSELSTFAETYKRNSQLYEMMPQDDGSLFTGLPVAYGKGDFSSLAPPEESLAYSACSPSDTRTPDLLSPQGVAFFTRKLSGSKRATSLFGSMVSSFSSTVSSTLGIFSAVTNATPTTNTNANAESTNSALHSVVVPSTSVPVPAQIPVLVPVPGPGLPVSTLKSLEVKEEVKEEVLRDADMIPLKSTKATVSVVTTVSASISLRSLQDLKCDPSLLSALTGLSKLNQDIVAFILDCVVNRKVYVLDAAVAVNALLKSNSNTKKKKSKEKKKGKKTDADLVCQILEKITKKPLGGNLAVAQAVSSCCVLLVYVLLEIEWGKIEENQNSNVKKEKEKEKDEKKSKENKNEEKAHREAVNDLIVSSFDRLAVATLSPFLGYDDVNWLTISDTSGGKRSTTDVITQPVVDPMEDALLSPRLRKRKAGVITDSPSSATRGLKKKRSLTEKTTPGISPPRSKRDCLWEVVSALKVRYQRVSTVSSAFRRLTRNFRPVAGVAGEISESDSSPLKSPGVNSPSPKGDDAKECAPPDRFLELLSMKGRTHGLRRASTFSGRTLPMIPLSVAGTALLFSAPQESQIQGLQPPVESDMSVASKDLSLGTSKGSGAGHTLKRTNSIVNVHKPSVGQRTGRGKGKSVRTSLKPDPNINSILSFTVPNGSSLGPRKGSPGSKVSRGQVKVNTLKAVEREKPHLERSDKRNSSSISSSSSSLAVSSKVSVPSSDVISSGGSVRRSARKRAREDGDSWRNPPTPLTCYVNEVEDTPVHKVRARKGSANLLASGMRVLRGTSPAVHGNVMRPSDFHSRPMIGRDSTHTQDSHSSQESSHRKGVIGAGIADSFASAVFGSGSSSRRNSTRRRVSIPFFLPDMGSEKDDDGAEIQTHSAGAALGMESNTQGGSETKGRRSPRFTTRLNTTVITSTAGNVPIEVELDRELSSSASTGSFSRNAFARSDNAPDSGKKVLQRRHSSAHVPSSPAPTLRLGMISTPPVQNIGKARMGSPVVHRSMADMQSRRTSPRRHYSPV